MSYATKKSVLALLLAGVASLVAALDVEAGVSTGVLFAPNPGEVFPAPASAGVHLHGQVPRAQAMRFTLGGSALAYPFLSTEPGFRDSPMVIFEALAGAAFRVWQIDSLGLMLAVEGGGGGYLRARVIESEGWTRRPVVTAGAAARFEHASGWRYQIGGRYRVLLDLTPRHTVEALLVIVRRLGRP